MQIISDLKKECFGLKMRIFYMEEKLRATYDSSTEETLKEVCSFLRTIYKWMDIFGDFSFIILDEV